MGYDVTFHAVNEQAVRSELIPWVLGEKSVPPAFAERFEDWQEIAGKVKDLLTGEDVISAARALTELSVMYAACLHPYVYERGRAFTLAVGEEEDPLADPPEDFSHNPEILFESLLVRHPSLRGHFPEAFEGNYMTGFFFPADKVPLLRAWLGKKLMAMDEGDREDYEQIENLIEYAADHGLAVWEATDISLPDAIALPRKVNPLAAADLEKTPLPFDISNRLCTYCPDSGAFYAYHRHQEQDPETHRWVVERTEALRMDFRTHPPRMHSRDVPGSALLGFGRHGVFPFYYNEDDKRVFAVTYDPFDPTQTQRLAPPPATVAKGAAKPSPAKGDFLSNLFGKFMSEIARVDDVGKPNINRGQIEYHGILGGRAIFIGRHWAYPAMENDAKALEWRTDLPKAQMSLRTEPQLTYDPGCLQLRNGIELLIWNGMAFVWRDDRFEPYCKAPIMENFEDFSYALWGEDGFYFLSKRCVYRVRPGQDPEACLPKIDNAMALGNGPNDGVLIREGNNKDGDVLKWWLPDEDKIYSLGKKFFDIPGGSYAEFFLWQAEANRIGIMSDDVWYNASVTAARAQPCRKVSSWRKIKKT